MARRVGSRGREGHHLALTVHGPLGSIDLLVPPGGRRHRRRPRVRRPGRPRCDPADLHPARPAAGRRRPARRRRSRQRRRPRGEHDAAPPTHRFVSEAPAARTRCTADESRWGAGLVAGAGAGVGDGGAGRLVRGRHGLLALDVRDRRPAAARGVRGRAADRRPPPRARAGRAGVRGGGRVRDRRGDRPGEAARSCSASPGSPRRSWRPSLARSTAVRTRRPGSGSSRGPGCSRSPGWRPWPTSHRARPGRLLLVLAMLAARVVPAIAIDVPDSYLIDMDRLAITAWSAREPAAQPARPGRRARGRRRGAWRRAGRRS